MLAAVLLTACGGDETADGDSEDTSSDSAAESPQPGGAVVYGITGETDGWSPATSQWTPGGLNVARAVYDPLAAFDAEGRPQPYLAESIEPSEDFTTWTITLREGVRFHNGDPLTAAIVAENLEAVRASGLIGPTLKLITSIDPSDERTVVVEMSEPWASFPVLLAQQPGFVAHPEVLNEDPNVPIGTGPFAYESWVVGDRFVATRNADYWQVDEEGNQLPYLDQVEFRVLPEPSTREASLSSGDVDLMQTNAPSTLVDYGPELDAGEGYNVYNTPAATDEQLIALNTQSFATDEPKFREALALATDREALNEQLYEGAFEIADTPYPDESRWDADVAWPEYDPERARELLDEVAAAGLDTEVTLSTGANTESLALAQAIAAMWEEAGITTEIESFEPTTLTLNIVTGQYEAAPFSLFNAPDPDGDYHFLDPSNRAPHGELSLDFTRYHSPRLKENMDAARRTTDEAERAESYAKVWEEIAENVPLIWLWHTEFVIVATDSVKGIDQMVLPDGEPAQLVNWGSVFLTRVWRA
ncbi:MAG: ABC transporter substrate-binding protein [Acidimicrobiia bacterium]|nr:ABC transporter substrate-binding protein [Acidimicrobiia bacterium]